MSVSSVIEGASFRFRLWHVRGEVERAGLKACHNKKRQDAGFEASATMPPVRAIYTCASGGLPLDFDLSGAVGILRGGLSGRLGLSAIFEEIGHFQAKISGIR